MGEQKFRASLSKGRKSWCVIFRHPALPDSNGKPGKRMRKGLGTGDKEIAQGLVDQWNALLGNESFWKPSAREEAGRIFDRKVVEDFYKGIEAKIEDPWKVRDEGIPLPGIDEGYAKTMLVGGTGGGKTTLLRQIIGTDFKKERFPSISTAKTT